MFDLRRTKDARAIAVTWEDLRSIGRLAKVHGTKGGVVLIWHDSLSFNPPDLTGLFAFLFLDGLPVPHQIRESIDRFDGTTLLHFAYIDTPEEARSLCGSELLIHKSALHDGQQQNLDYHDLDATLANRVLLDQNGKQIGIVRSVQAFSINVLLLVETPEGAELMVPFHESLILHFPTETNQPIQLIIPDGLDDL